VPDQVSRPDLKYSTFQPGLPPALDTDDIFEVLKNLPQRYPILMIDRVKHCDTGKRIVALKNVSANEPYFQGHFPGRPIMPGVLLTEAMAQSCGWLILGVLKFERMPFLAIVKEAKMRGFVSPGQVLTIDAKLEHEGSGFAVAKAKGRIGKDVKCSAEITFGLSPFPDPAFRVHMDAMASKIGFPLKAVAQ